MTGYNPAPAEGSGFLEPIDSIPRKASSSARISHASPDQRRSIWEQIMDHGRNSMRAVARNVGVHELAIAPTLRSRHREETNKAFQRGRAYERAASRTPRFPEAA